MPCFWSLALVFIKFIYFFEAAHRIYPIVTQEQGECLTWNDSMFHLSCGRLSPIKHVVCEDTAAQVALSCQIMIQAPPEAGNRAGKTGCHMQ